MGLKASTFCCTYCNTRLPTEEDEFLGIKAEVREKYKECEPLPFQSYLRRRNSVPDTDTMLGFLSSHQIDYFHTNNKLMQRSAILDIKEIPEIPTPNTNSFIGFPHKEKRSASLTSRKDILRELFPLFLPKNMRP